MPVFVVRAATSSRRFGYAGESATDSGESSRCASSPPTAATARPRSTGSSPTWVSRTWRFRAQLDRPRRGEPTNTETRSAAPSNGAPAAKAGSATSERYGWDRTRIDGIEGARIWTGHGVAANTRPTRNLVALISPAAEAGAVRMPQRPAATLVATALGDRRHPRPPKGSSPLGVELVDAVGEGLHDDLALELEAWCQIACLDGQFAVDDSEFLDLLPSVELVVQRIDVAAYQLVGLFVAGDLGEGGRPGRSWRPIR